MSKRKEKFEQDNSFRSGTDKVYPMKFDSVMPTPSIKRSKIDRATKEFFDSGKKATVVTAEDLSKKEVAPANPFRRSKSSRKQGSFKSRK